MLCRILRYNFMLQGYRVGAIILMGGSGSRFGGETPKQFLLLGDKRVYLHTLEAFEQTLLFDEILLVCHPSWVQMVAQEAPRATVIGGGQTRQESSFLGLQSFAIQPDIVCIHDAVRPFISLPILQENITQALLHGAVDTCIPSADTLVHAPQGRWISSIPKRAEYWRGQTPQTFHYSLLWNAHQVARASGMLHASDDCQLVLAQGHPVHIVLGSEENLKITTAFDFSLATMILSTWQPNR